jgi:hypothetical protein
MPSFIYTLPSNVPNCNGTNTLSRYVTELPSALKLDRGWRVGLCEISYTKSWFNVKQTQTVTIIDDRGGLFECPQKLERGMYETEQHLVDAINASIRSTTMFDDLVKGQASGMELRKAKPKEQDLSKFSVLEYPRIKLNPFNHVATLSIGKRRDGVRLYAALGKEIEEMLGISQDSFLYSIEETTQTVVTTVHTKSIKGRGGSFRAYDLNAGVHSLMVYCNLVEPVLVGNTYSQLLRSVSIPHSVPFGNQVVIPFQKLYYLPLSSTEFQTIEIEIRDDSNQLIDFQWGRTTITLEFVNDA